MILKECSSHYCEKKYPGKLKDPINLCPEHNTNENRDKLIQKFKKLRYIPIDNFDVWDDQYKHKWYKIERVCRICGSRLLSKGKYNNNKRYCSPKTCKGDEVWFSFNSSKWKKMDENQEKYQVTIRLQFLEIFHEILESYLKYHEMKGSFFSGYDKLFEKKVNDYVCCGRCGKLLEKWKHEIEVHHVEPVSILDESNFWLIWELSNLVVLCHECHKKAPEHAKFRPEKKEKPKIKYRSLLEFIPKEIQQ